MSTQQTPRIAIHGHRYHIGDTILVTNSKVPADQGIYIIGTFLGVSTNYDPPHVMVSIDQPHHTPDTIRVLREDISPINLLSSSGKLLTPILYPPHPAVQSLDSLKTINIIAPQVQDLVESLLQKLSKAEEKLRDAELQERISHHDQR